MPDRPRSPVRLATLLAGALLSSGASLSTAVAAAVVDLGFGGVVADLGQWVATVTADPPARRGAELTRRMPVLAARLSLMAEQEAALAQAVRRNETPSPDDLAHSLRTVRDEYKYLADDLEAADPEFARTNPVLVNDLDAELSLDVWLPKSGAIEHLRLADPAVRDRVADELTNEAGTLGRMAQCVRVASQSADAGFPNSNDPRVREPAAGTMGPGLRASGQSNRKQNSSGAASH